MSEPSLLDRVKRIEAMVCVVGKIVSKYDEQFERMAGVMEHQAEVIDEMVSSLSDEKEEHLATKLALEAAKKKKRKM